MAEFYPGGTAVIALARTRCDFHLAEQRVHLDDREDAAGADRAVAGDGRGNEVELVAQAERIAELGDLRGEVGEQARGISLAERGRHRPNKHR
jgi:hypothetical protein